MRHLIITLLISSLLWGCSSNKPKEENPLAQAENSYAQGHYHKAAAQLMPLAKNGDAHAQYTLGYMYYYGQGLPKDRTQGHFWMQQSAKQGNKSALKALELLNQESRKGATTTGTPVMSDPAPTPSPPAAE